MPSNPYAEVRGALAKLMADAGLRAYTAPPEIPEDLDDADTDTGLVYPLVYVVPGDPYVERDGAVFGGEFVHCNIVAIAGEGANDKVADQLDGLIARVVDVVDASDDWTFERVTRTGRVVLDNKPHLASSVEAYIEIHRS